MAAPDPGRLARVLVPRFGTGVTVVGLRRLSGGASRETWSFDAVAGGDVRHPLVLRRDPGEHQGQSDRSVEYELLRVARDAGVLVPEVEVLLGPDDGLGAGFVMRRVEGETIARKILRDEPYAKARTVLAADCGVQAARIHAVDTDRLPALPVQGAAEQIVQYRDTMDALGESHPAFELGFRWLLDHTPRESPARRALVHGDFRNGNFVVGPDGLRAVLDWELAHLGDPVEDLGWLCVKSWRFGAASPVGGFGGYDELLDAYEGASGRTVTLDELRFWEVFGTLKWGVICQMQASLHWSGVVRSVELASLGRRVAEMEWDLLATIEELGG
ncbi:MAG TPA: phosphotransferase family protein [Acidimicrobiia bacterium]|jgi:aminoglycoside phosphotransferase (APT) family kinase protein